jgi:hypothetical protein
LDCRRVDEAIAVCVESRVPVSVMLWFPSIGWRGGGRRRATGGEAWGEGWSTEISYGRIMTRANSPATDTKPVT